MIYNFVMKDNQLNQNIKKGLLNNSQINLSV